MLEYVPYLPVQLMLGAYKIPPNSQVIGSHAVRNTKTGASGVLIRFNATGAYCLFCAGVIRTVDHQDVLRLLAQK